MFLHKMKVSNISELIQRIEQESKLELQKHKKAEKQTKSILINMGYQFRGGTQNTNVRKTPNSRQRTNGEAANGNASLDKNNTSVTSNPLLTRKRRHSNETSKPSNNGQQAAKVIKSEINLKENEEIDHRRLFNALLPNLPLKNFDPQIVNSNGDGSGFGRLEKMYPKMPKRLQEKQLLDTFMAIRNHEPVLFEKYKKPSTPESNLNSVEKSKKENKKLDKKKQTVSVEKTIERTLKNKKIESIEDKSIFKCQMCNVELKGIKVVMTHRCTHDNIKLPTTSERPTESRVSSKQLNIVKKSIKKEKVVEKTTSRSKRASKPKQNTLSQRKGKNDYSSKKSTKNKKDGSNLNELDTRPLIPHGEITKDNVAASVKAVKEKRYPVHILGDRTACFEQLRAREGRSYCDYCMVVNWSEEDEWFKHFSRCKNYVDGWSYCALCKKCWRSGMCFNLHWTTYHSSMPLPSTKHFLNAEDPVDPTLKKQQ